MNEKQIKDFSEKTVQEDIRAEVEKTKSWLIFLTVVLFMILIGFCANTCSKMPPDLNNSVDCTKIGGQWVPTEFKTIDNYTHEIAAYCSLKK